MDVADEHQGGVVGGGGSAVGTPVSVKRRRVSPNPFQAVGSLLGLLSRVLSFFVCDGTSLNRHFLIQDFKLHDAS